jgi:hypothetical protein
MIVMSSFIRHCVALNSQGGNAQIQLDAQQTARQAARLIPFLTLLLLSSLFEHSTGLITVIACSVALTRIQTRIDQEIKRLVGKQKIPFIPFSQALTTHSKLFAGTPRQVVSAVQHAAGRLSCLLALPHRHRSRFW